MSVELVVPAKQETPANLSLVLSVCGQALKTFGATSITPLNVLLVLQHIILAIKKLTKLSEEEKKQLALDSISWLINNQTNLTDDEKKSLDLLAITIFPQAIDLLSEQKDAILSCFGCCTKK